MKKFFFILTFLLTVQFGFAQVGINTTNPNAQLDIRSSNQLTPSNTDGILIPKIDAFPLVNPTVLQQGMMVYLTTISAGKSPGFYYWDNVTVNWIGLGGSGASTGWLTTGNTGTSAATNFIGTTDNNDVVFKRFNSKAGLLGGYITGFGAFSLNANTTGNGNTAFGAYSLLRNTTGSNNVALGSDAMSRIVEGSNGTSIGYASMFYFSGPNTPFVNTNTAIGYYSMLGEHSGSLAGSNNVGLRNTAIGYQVLQGISSGNDNTALGYLALEDNGRGNENVAIGSNSLSNSTNANKNIAIGNNSLFTQNFSNGGVVFDSGNIAVGLETLYSNNPTATFNGIDNVAIGNYSLRSNTIGYDNSAIGASSLFSNTSGRSITAIGSRALYRNTTGSFNVTTGFSSLYSNTTGALNTANGSAALYSNTTGYENTATGAGSLYTNSTGYQNVANGLDALYFNTIGTGNVATGYRTLYNNTSGNHNVANGFRSLYSNTAGVGNIAFGFQSLYSNTTGNTNIAAGSGSLYSNTNGQSNVAIGPATLYLNTTGSGNIATGISSLYSNTIGNNNIGYGFRSLYLNTSGNFNIAIGDLALNSNTTGSSNIANGSQALFSNTTGSNNIAIGDQAGFYETGSNKLYIENSDSATPLIYGEFNNDLLRFHGNLEVDNITTANNKMQLVNKNNYTHAIGNQVFGSGGDDLILSSQENSTETAGFYGDGNAVSIWSAGDANGGQSPALVYFLDEDAFDGANTNPYDNNALKSYISPVGAYVQISDKNKKENIVKIENASEKIENISGYTYQFKLSSEEVKKGDKPIKSSGVLAQELEKVLPEAVQKNEKGEYFVDYAAITPLLIEAIKAQNEKIKALENSQNEILKRLDMLEKK